VVRRNHRATTRWTISIPTCSPLLRTKGRVSSRRRRSNSIAQGTALGDSTTPKHSFALKGLDPLFPQDAYNKPYVGIKVVTHPSGLSRWTNSAASDALSGLQKNWIGSSPKGAALEYSVT
jgi:hypothetical protein